MKGLGLSVFLAVILIGALGSLFLEDILIKAPEVRQPGSDAPIYYFEDFTMRVMDADGHPAYLLAGKNMFGYRDDEVDAWIDAPQLEIDVAPQPGWDVTAEKGSVAQGGDLLFLRGSVVLLQTGARAKSPLRIETETLDLDTRKRIASTDAAVEFTAPQWRVRSVGMHAQIQDGVVELLADVHARYTPAVSAP